MKLGSWEFWNKKKTGDAQITSPRRPFAIKSGVVVNPDSAMQVAAFYRGLIYVSSQVAKLPWTHKNKKREEIDGRIANLLDLKPNKETNAFRFKLWLIQNTIIHGNSFCEIERDAIGRPVAIWPLGSGDVELWRDTNGELWYVVLSATATNRSGVDVWLKPKDVFHIANFHMKDSLLGQGVVAYATEVLGVALGSNQLAGGIFANGGLPSGVLEVPTALDDEAYDRLKKSWREAYSGKNAGATAILEEGIKYQATSIPPNVLQFLESRQFSVSEIARYLGVPPTKLFDNTAATQNNVEHGSLEVVNDTLDPWTINMELEADIKLLDDRKNGEYTEIDLSQATRADIKTKAAYYKDMEQSAALTPNEIRKEIGKPDYEEGDRYYIASNNFSPVDRMDEIIDANIKQKESKSEGGAPKDDQAAALQTAATNYLLEKTKKN